jgi:hypothetical protein
VRLKSAGKGLPRLPSLQAHNKGRHEQAALVSSQASNSATTRANIDAGSSPLEQETKKDHSDPPGGTALPHAFIIVGKVRARLDFGARLNAG